MIVAVLAIYFNVALVFSTNSELYYFISKRFNQLISLAATYPASIIEKKALFRVQVAHRVAPLKLLKSKPLTKCCAIQ